MRYWSRAFTKQEHDYNTTEKECMPIVWAILLLRPYLEGQRFTIQMYSDSLRWVLNLADAKGRLARWRLRLSEHDYLVEHRTGIKRQPADALSRLETTGVDISSLREEISCYLINTVPVQTDELNLHPGNPEVVALAELDEMILLITQGNVFREQHRDPYCRTIANDVRKSRTQFEVNRHGLLCRREPLDGGIQIVIPTPLRASTLFRSHYPRTQGHPGTGCMYETMRRQYFWPHMASEVQQTVADCRSCGQMRRTQRRQQKTLFPVAGPLEFVAMHLYGPQPKIPHRNRHILVIPDRFTKMSRTVPLRTAQDSQVAQAFLDACLYPYRMPDTLLTDDGPQFTAKFWESVYGMLFILHVLTTAYHPPTNGQAERFNRTLATRLRHFRTPKGLG